MPQDPTQTQVSQAANLLLDFRMPEQEMYHRKWFHWRIEEAGADIVECAPGAQVVGDLDVDEDVVIRFPVFAVAEAHVYFAEKFLKLSDEYSAYMYYAGLEEIAKVQQVRDIIKQLVPPEDQRKIPLPDSYLSDGAFTRIEVLD
jgi:hypothetical protein